MRRRIASMQTRRIALRKICLAAALCATMFSTSAHAVLLNFTLSGTDTGFWQIDSNPTPSSIVFSGNPFAPIQQFTINNVNSTINGVTLVRTFRFDASGGASFIATPSGAVMTNTSLFTAIASGSTFVPQFNLGTITGDAGAASTRNSVTISAAPVPEPTSWALMIAGLAVMGAALRRRSVLVTVKSV
jgi:hypothetical protein